MRHPLRPAVFLAVALATGPSALAQGPIDTSSPDAVMASLAELHERWTFSQFAEFTRAVPVLAAPAHFESAVLSEDRRAGGLTEGLALLYISLLDLPLALESDPFASHVSPERLHEGLEQVLHGHTVRDVVHAGRNREQAFLPRPGRALSVQGARARGRIGEC